MFALAVFPNNPLLAAYGIALAGLGLLTTTGYILAMDTFGPITDNANGIFEMSGVLEEDASAGRGMTAGGISGDRIVARLDAVGNTTKALTKGFAIATAVIAAVALFRSFMTDAGTLLRESGIRLDVPEVFIGLLIGGAAPFLFSSFAINAVGRAAVQLIEEVRRQFREDPGIMLGTSKPDYARCVAIVTAAAQKELLGPGILAIGLPILVGFGLGFRDPKTARRRSAAIWRARSSAGNCWRCCSPTRAARGTTPRRRSRTACSAAREPRTTKRPSSAIRSAIRSRTRPARR